jgi:mono/diheme cytochrome c family protein
MAKRILRKVSIGLGAFAVITAGAAVGTYVWARSAAAAKLSTRHDAHTADFAIPFPLAPDDAARVQTAGGDPKRVALEQAVARGKHLLAARYACQECHGANFGGGKMIDDPAIGTVLGPNLTAGRGGRTQSYTAADWDRIVRHGIKPDGTAAVMPSEDFARMSDQELSDIIAYIRSVPAVDNEVPAPVMGPLGSVLLALGKIPLSAETIADHRRAHAALPPEDGPTLELGAHLAATCTGCHGPNLSGGPVAGGDPSWPPAANLTPHTAGLADWSEADFVRSMREGVSRDGRMLRDPMSKVTPWTSKMTANELKALWMHLRAQPAVSTGVR